MNKIFNMIYLTATIFLMIILQPFVLLVFMVDYWPKRTNLYNSRISQKIDKIKLTQYTISPELHI